MPDYSIPKKGPTSTYPNTRVAVSIFFNAITFNSFDVNQLTYLEPKLLADGCDDSPDDRG